MFYSKYPDSFYTKEYGFFILQKYFKKGERIQTHCHDFFEVEIILDGNILHECNNSTQTIGRGDVYMLTPQDVHSVAMLTDVNLINIRFTLDVLPECIVEFLSKHTSCITCRLEEGDIEYVTLLSNRIQSEKIDSLFYKEYIQHMLFCILFTIIRQDYHEISAIPNAIPQMLAYLSYHFREDISLNSMAKELYMSSEHAGRVFKKYTGMSFNKYLNKLRLEYACKSLHHQRLSIKEIAFDSGYNSLEYFVDVFKREYKITPTKYREEWLKNRRTEF